MAKFTKGPWRVEEIDPIIWSVPKIEVIAEARTDFFEPDEVRANAQLIASAPNLLAGCERALKALVLGDLDDKNREINFLRKVIAKAKGKFK